MRRSWSLLAGLVIAVAMYFFFNMEMWRCRNDVRSESSAEYVLPSKFSRILSLGYRGLLSDYLFLKTAAFYGERLMTQKPLSGADWDYFATSLDVITDLDPYFFDPYLLAEGNMAWEGKIQEANKLLKKGMKYRSWDWRIPYFIGFNYFYFLKDYEKGAEYVMAAARLPGGPPYLKTLGSRLAYYGGKTKTGILFLKGMIAETEDPRFRAPLEKRLLALERAEKLELLVNRFKEETGRSPAAVNELVERGYIDSLPEDPYGGKWVILPTGRIFSTSKFASTPEKQR
ncbi:hypothetical protein JCM30471_01270 [Desulfuromonas carbonis]|uniref:hypothetical protein n=1 Tax=Desulfuromonas sp. DDH964 TaxID=1823759 RepID=UPI00078DE6EE|nr:hypothetical protein [Desulfuromonas sp. DDH964]AMV71813.1 hypothetical protein DBW_1451 [Desulfuromonas sp. DDH964]